MKHLLAHKDGIRIFLGILIEQGAMCDACGFGTKVISKTHAQCKKCGKKINRAVKK